MNNDLHAPTCAVSDTRSYIQPVKIGEVMRGAVVGQVQASKSKAFPSGTYVEALVGWAELGIAKEKDLKRIDVPKNGKLTDTLGVLGMQNLRSFQGSRP